MDDRRSIDDRTRWSDKMPSKRDHGLPRRLLTSIVSPLPTRRDAAGHEISTRNSREDRKRMKREERDSRKKFKEWIKKVATCLVKLEVDVTKDYFKEINIKMDPGGRLFTPWVLALVKHCDCSVLPKDFLSTPDQGKTVGDHAEERVLKHYIDGLAVIESINLTYSPCSSCTVRLLLAFLLESKEKPTINFLCVHGDADSEDRIQAFKNLELLWMHGFTFDVWWDFQDDIKCLLPANYSELWAELQVHRSQMDDRASELKHLLQLFYEYLLSKHVFYGCS